MKPLILCAALVLAVAGCADDPVAAMAFDAAPVAAAGATAVHPPSQKVEELVAPIALYPDVLVAQMLAAATQPAEVVHAGLWLDEHRGASAVFSTCTCRRRLVRGRVAGPAASPAAE